MTNVPGNVSCQPYWSKTPEYYMIQQERQAHEDAIWAYGEYSMFALLWNIDDFENNLVVRCPWCIDRGGIEGQIAAVYRQSAEAGCSYCYGTTFWSLEATQLPGLKALIVRPAMWEQTDETHKQVAQGNVTAAIGQLQSISDFRMRTGDYVFKADMTRWRVHLRSTDNISSGLQASNDVRTMIGYNYSEIVRESETSMAFLIPPLGPAVQSLLDVSPVPNFPVCFDNVEIINGDLIGDAFAAN